MPWGSDIKWLPAAHRASSVTRITQIKFVVTLPCLVCSVSQTILLSPDYSCSEEILSIVSLLSVDTVLYNPPARREEVLAARKKFTSSEGDHMTLLNIYRAFKKVSGNKASDAKSVGEENALLCCWATYLESGICLLLQEWCRENFVNSRNMGLVKEVQAQLRDICLKVHNEKSLWMLWMFCEGLGSISWNQYPKSFSKLPQ